MLQVIYHYAGMKHNTSHSKNILRLHLQFNWSLTEDDLIRGRNKTSCLLFVGWEDVAIILYLCQMFV